MKYLAVYTQASPLAYMAADYLLKQAQHFDGVTAPLAPTPTAPLAKAPTPTAPLAKAPTPTAPPVKAPTPPKTAPTSKGTTLILPVEGDISLEH